MDGSGWVKECSRVRLAAGDVAEVREGGVGDGDKDPDCELGLSGEGVRGEDMLVGWPGNVPGKDNGICNDESAELKESEVRVSDGDGDDSRVLS